MSPPDVSLDRRAFLSLATVASVGTLAGCKRFSPPRPDVVVFNKREKSLTVTVTLAESNGDEIFSTETSIDGEDAYQRDDVLPDDGPVTLAVDAEGGPSGTNEFDLDGNNLSLQATVSEEVEFRKN